MAAGLLPGAEAYFSSPIRDYYPGQLVAGVPQARRLGMQGMVHAGGRLADMGETVSGAYADRVAQGPQWNPYLEQVADRYMDDMTEQFSERTLPALRGAQVAGNALGSSAAGIADALAAEDFGSQVSQGLANLYAKGFDTTQGMYQSLLGQAPQQLPAYGAATSAPAQALTAQGAFEQQMLQNQIDAEVGRWNWYRDAAPRRLNQYSASMGFIPAESQQMSQSYAGPDPKKAGFNWGKTLAGGLMAFGPDIYDAWKNRGDASADDDESWDDVPEPYGGWGGGGFGGGPGGGFSDFLGF